MLRQIEEYLEKYKITSKEMLEKHIEELSRNTYVDKDLVFMLVMFLDDEELFSRKKENKKTPYSTVESNSKKALQEIYGDLADITKNKKGNYQVSIAHTKENMNRLVEEELERQEQQVFKDWNSNNTIDTNRTAIGWDIFKPIKKEPIAFHLDSPSEENLNKMSDSFLQRVKNDSDKGGILGKKETKGKLYYELSWEFIEEMAKRMANNKSDKYPLYNWKKNIDVEELKQAINRHHIEVMKGNYKDGDEVLGHVVSYACNAMMLWEQLKNK